MLGIKINSYIDDFSLDEKKEIAEKLSEYIIENWNEKILVTHEDISTTDLVVNF